MQGSPSKRARAETPEVHFPNDFDQEHYLNVMTNFKRWRTPSPSQVFLPSPSITQTSSSDSLVDPPRTPKMTFLLSPERGFSEGETPPTFSSFSTGFDARMAVVPMSADSSDDSLVLGDPLFREEPDGSSGSQTSPADCSSGSLQSPLNSTPGDSGGLPSMILAAKVKNSIEHLDKIARSKKHHHSQAHPSASDGLESDKSWEYLPPELFGGDSSWGSEGDNYPMTNLGKILNRNGPNDVPVIKPRISFANVDGTPARTKLIDSSAYYDAKEIPSDCNNHGTDFLLGSKPVDDNSRIVLNLDSSRAATLTRTCKFGGYFRKIPESGDLTVNELREMATRQQQHIESQQQLLVAREQRLKYLKQQEGRTSQVNMETERLRRLRERVEAQEAKLRRLRALRGQVDSSRQNAASLYSDLDAMRHLFSEKEKELVDAAAKVEELTRQLEDVRGGRGVVSGTQNGGVTTPSQLQIHHQELEKLRRELLYRNSVNREASTRVASQRDALTTRKEEIVRIDKRIAELTQRLHRKRVLNQQLTTQISAATQAKQAQLKAVQQKALREGKNDHSADNVNMEELRTLEDISQFDRGKHDPKYQTLPYNTKFSSGVKGPVPGPGSGPRHPYENSGMDQDLCSPSSDSNQSQSASVVNNIRNSGFVSSTTTSSASSNSNNNATNSNSNAGVITRTVHSIPAHLASKGHALAPGQSSNSTVIPASTTHNSLARGQNSIAGGSSSPIKQNHLSNQLYQQKGQPEQLGQQVPVTSSIQDIRANLPPTSLSASFSQKMVPGVSAHVQNRNIVGPPVHPQQTNINKDVENVRALGYPAGSSMMPSSQPVTSYQTSNSSSTSQLPSSNSTVTTSKTNSSGGPSLISSTGELQDENSDTIIGKLKPVLPPKPVVPSKPTPPPRQKGDPLASSTESLNLIGVSNHRPSSSIRPQVFRYASQNVILSTYTQQQQQQQNNHHQPVSSAREPQVNKPIPGANVNLINQLNDKQNNDSSKGSQPKPSSKDVGESIGEDLSEKVHISSNRRIEMPPDFLFPEDATPPSDLLGHQLEDFIRDRSQMEGRGGRHADEQNDAQPPSESQSRQIEQISSVASSVDQGLRLTENSKSEISENNSLDTTDRVNITNHNNVQNNNISNTLNNCANNLNVINNNVSTTSNEMERLRINNTMMEGGEKGDNEKEHIKMAEEIESNQPTAPSSNVVRRLKKGNLKTTNSSRAAPRRVSFDPLALLLDASLEGELELVKRTATEVPNPSAANDEGITALHNAICAGHLDIVTFLVTFGCDVNAQDSDGWTPLHCAASCNNVSMVRFLVEHGACVLATTLSDHETAAEKCEQDEEGYDGCSQYLYSVQEKLGIMNGGAVYAVYDYDSQNDDELSFKCGDSLTVIRRGDEYEREWWWVRNNDKCGYVPRNLLGLCPRVKNPLKVS